MAKRPAPARRPATVAASQSSGNPIVQRLSALSKENRATVLKDVHPLYKSHATQYRLLLDAYEGAGGFLTGEYLWKYPNEKDTEFRQRQEQARYHNYVRALVNIYVRHVFRAGVTREAKGMPALETFWANVDGAGTTVEHFMKRGAKLALAGGLAGALVDKEPVPAVGPRMADDRGRVIASWFAAPSIVDWTLKAGALQGVKLLEATARDSILDPVPSGDDAVQYLFWQPDAWARFNSEGDVVAASDGVNQTIGAVPLAFVRPDPSAENPFLGHALAGNANVFRALFNRCSEEDEILRDQAFSQLTVSVPPDGNVEDVKKQIGNDIGTTTAIVAHGEVSYITADMGVPEQIRKNIEFLIKEIYRMAHVRFERDSLDAESGDALRLQYTELNEMLANLAQELQDAELQIAKYVHAWTSPGSMDAIEESFERANVSIVYGREFFVEDLMAELEKWAKAVSMDLGLEFEHYAKKRAVDQLAPNLPPDLKMKVYAEIDGQASKREQAIEDAQARIAGSTERLMGGGKKPSPPAPDDDAKADDKAA